MKGKLREGKERRIYLKWERKNLLNGKGKEKNGCHLIEMEWKDSLQVGRMHKGMEECIKGRDGTEELYERKGKGKERGNEGISPGR